jgi:hypothetical protein
MSLSFRRRPKIAPLRERALARAIDIGLVVAAIGGPCAVLARRDLRASGAGSRDPSRPTWGGRLQSWPTRAALAVATLAVRLVTRRHGSPGDRAVGLRSVDARTGAPPTVAWIVARSAWEIVGEQLSRSMTRPLLRRGTAAREQLHGAPDGSLSRQEQERLARATLGGCLPALGVGLGWRALKTIVGRRLQAAGRIPRIVRVRAR